MAERPIVRDARAPGLRAKLPGLALGAVFLSLAALACIRLAPPSTGAAIGGLFFGYPAQSADNFTSQERSTITAEFLAHGPVAVRRIRLSELDAAIGGMGLTAAQESALRADIALLLRAKGNSASQRVAAFIEAGPAAAVAPAPAAVVANGAAPPRAARPQPAAQSTPEPRAAAQPVADDEVELPLAWLTLWDHRDEDGDIVRVVSEGYMRTVPILNAPVTLAVPAPASGVVNIIGIHDGTGGITVGIRSGVTPVLLPVLSVGQAVGVPIVVR
ncbi:MAG: hypothetical protein IOD03_20495 [Methylocystis sp.]|nr:hypothetical protein [Methylocystis sp.]